MSDTPRVVAVLGRGVVALDEPVVMATDLGLTRGDGCFEATRCVVDDDGVRIDHLDAHLERLARSASALDLPAPDRGAWREVIEEACSAWTGRGEGVVRWMLTRGVESAPEKPVTGLVTVEPIPASTLAHRSGIDVATLSRGHDSAAFVDVPWLLAGVKTLSYAVNIAAAREAKRRGVHDVIFVSTDGYVLEAPRSAVIWRVGNRLATTPVGATGILESITARAALAGAVNAGVRIAHELIRPDDLLAADGIWVASSSRLIAPVVSVDGTPVSHDRGWTDRLMDWAITTAL